MIKYSALQVYHYVRSPVPHWPSHASLPSLFTNSVSRKVIYLVVGNNGNPCWMFFCYGRKVERAMQLRKEGYSIMVVHENDFWDEVG